MKPLYFLLALLLAPGLGCTAAEEGSVPTPACASPAPLSLAKEGSIADTWIVMLDDDIADVRAETDALATRHSFAVGSRLDIIRGFVALADEEKIARLRCEKTVKSITQERRTKALSSSLRTED
jgi:hypothetical protein